VGEKAKTGININNKKQLSTEDDVQQKFHNGHSEI
jgi:hypothetical protein